MRLETAIDEFLDTAYLSRRERKSMTFHLQLFRAFAGDIEVHDLEPEYLHFIADIEHDRRRNAAVAVEPHSLYEFFKWCYNQGYLEAFGFALPRPWLCLSSRCAGPGSLFVNRLPEDHWLLG